MAKAVTFVKSNITNIVELLSQNQLKITVETKDHRRFSHTYNDKIPLNTTPSISGLQIKTTKALELFENISKGTGGHVISYDDDEESFTICIALVVQYLDTIHFSMHLEAETTGGSGRGGGAGGAGGRGGRGGNQWEGEFWEGEPKGKSQKNLWNDYTEPTTTTTTKQNVPDARAEPVTPGGRGYGDAGDGAYGDGGRVGGSSRGYGDAGDGAYGDGGRGRGRGSSDARYVDGGYSDGSRGRGSSDARYVDGGSSDGSRGRGSSDARYVDGYYSDSGRGRGRDGGTGAVRGLGRGRAEPPRPTGKLADNTNWCDEVEKETRDFEIPPERQEGGRDRGGGPEGNRGRGDRVRGRGRRERAVPGASPEPSKPLINLHLRTDIIDPELLSEYIDGAIKSEKIDGYENYELYGDQLSVSVVSEESATKWKSLFVELQ